MTKPYVGVTLSVLWLSACGGPPTQPADAVGQRVEPAPATVAVTAEAGTTQLPSRAAVPSTVPPTVPPAELWHANSSMRQSVLDELADQDVAALYAAMPLLVTDADPAVRQAAIEAMLDHPTDATIDYLLASLSDPHPAVREASMDALAELRGLP